MRTVIETPTFQKQATSIWSKDEREAFIDWIAQNPDAGDVIQDAQGARKVRWARKGTGKSGGARVIYYHLVDDQVVLPKCAESLGRLGRGRIARTATPSFEATVAFAVARYTAE